jgi:cephalosporin hydroxylase
MNARNGSVATANRIKPVTESSERTDYDFYQPYPKTWVMENPERLAMMTLLNWLKPACSLEIGTREGGSLGVIAEHSGHVFTLDIDPGCQAAVRPHSNVELVVGDSHKTLPGVLNEISERQLSLEFVLIDGEHSAEGVRGDIERLLEYRPTRPCYILMHDSFNPFCRDGMATAPWERSPYVHRVDLDFIPGKIYHPDENGWGTPNGHEMWCGFGLAVLRPEERVGPLTVLASADHLYSVAYRHSTHRLLIQAKRWLGSGRFQSLKRALGYRRSQRLKRFFTGERKRPWDTNS